MTIKLTGEVFEVGEIEGIRGIRIKPGGEHVSILGLTEEECKIAAQWFGEEVEVIIKRKSDGGDQ